ncbi:hypothetical protein [Nevskia sp.]|uniref:hypothetical protein n=1 Tax=Nevskia sp. TaxID=1929292 RepID=UPI003F71A2D0
MNERPNLLQLRPSIERELQDIGAVITQCTESQLQFKGGVITYRPLINLVGGSIYVTTSNSIASSARISFTTVMLLLMAGFIALPFSLAAIFFLPVSLVLLFAAAIVMALAWGHAEQWLVQLVERAVVQQRAPRDGFAPREL